MNNFVTRVLFAIIGIPAFLFLLYKGGYFLLSLLAALVLLGSLEFIEMLKNKGIKIPKIFVVFNLLIFVSFSLSHYFWTLVLFMALFVALAIYNLNQELSGGLLRLSCGMFSALYIGFFMGCAYKIWTLESMLIICVLVLVWVTDTFAYLIGMSLGHHRGFIKASPKKSLEGFLGGFCFCIFSGYLFSIFYFNSEQTFILTISVAIGIMAQLGDVVASSLKRDCDVKDSGNLLPGHGGVIDRFDSLLLVAPVVYVIAIWYYGIF